VRVKSGLVFAKPVYGGWLEVEVTAGPGTVPVVTLDLAGIDEPGQMGGAEAGAGAVPAEVLEVRSRAAAEQAVRCLELLPPDARSVDLVHAKRIVAAGMGAADQQLLAAASELADLLEGSVGATRPMVDDGRLPKERLIGQTGRTVTPDLYMALGISGSPHHVAGVRKAEKIVAINRDPRAPIFQFSDVGYVADLREVLPALVARIKEWRDAGK
jgi:electron transfer flavoprotein alpha subunit